MENFIIVRAGVNGGKTTTCGQLYEELKKNPNIQNYLI